MSLPPSRQGCMNACLGFRTPVSPSLSLFRLYLSWEVFPSHSDNLMHTFFFFQKSRIYVNVFQDGPKCLSHPIQPTHQLWIDDSELARSLHPEGLFLICSRGLEGPFLPFPLSKYMPLLLRYHLLGGAFPNPLVFVVERFVSWEWPVR